MKHFRFTFAFALGCTRARAVALTLLTLWEPKTACLYLFSIIVQHNRVVCRRVLPSLCCLCLRVCLLTLIVLKLLENVCFAIDHAHYTSCFDQSAPFGHRTRLYVIESERERHSRLGDRGRRSGLVWL